LTRSQFVVLFKRFSEREDRNKVTSKVGYLPETELAARFLRKEREEGEREGGRDRGEREGERERVRERERGRGKKQKVLMAVIERICRKR